MKIFAFFMAFYILVLSAVPCSDVHNDCNSSKTKTEIAQNHNHQEDQDDNCSPFCICSCCSASIVMANLQPFQIKVSQVFVLTTKAYIRKFSFLSNFSNTIWQPPKAFAIC